MRDRYEYDGYQPDEAGTRLIRRAAEPVSRVTMQLDEPEGSSRTSGLRRLSRLTWRTTQLSAVAAAAFAVLFARSAPAQTASSQAAAPAKAPASASPTPAHTSGYPRGKVTAARKPRHRAVTKAAAHPAATAQPSTPPPAAPTPTPTPTRSSAPAPPTTAPAPAPSPTPVHTTSSPSPTGG
jgi:hypothetical protein